jgi:trimeric autotransporter adhesin
MKKTILLFVCFLAFGFVSYSQFYVDPLSGKVGIGTITPSQTIDINGTARIRSILNNNTLNKVLAVDSTGTVFWRDAAALVGNTWSLNGNSGTVDSVNFIGTTDDKPFKIKVNNQPAGKIDAFAGSSFFGYQAGQSTTQASASGQSSNNTAIGGYSLYSNTKGAFNTAIGTQAYYSNVAGSRATAVGANAMYYSNNTSTEFTNFNVAVGYEALRGSIIPSSNTGNNNTAVGYQALLNNTSGGFNTAIGQSSLLINNTGANNTTVGYQALLNNTSGSFNIAIGQGSLIVNNIGINNTAVGYQALSSNTSGANNTAIGYNANVNGGMVQATNSTAIGNGALANASNTIQLGNSSVTQVFAGTGTNATLTAGRLKMTGGTPGVGKILTSDATGLASWTAPAANGWSLTGNTGIVDGTNFIGPTDYKPLTFKISSQKAGRLEGPLLAGSIGQNGNSSFGYQALNSNTTGDSNTAVGLSALSVNTTGISNTALGASAGPNLNNLSNTTSLGSGAVTTASNSIRVGNSSVTSIGGQVGWSTLSDGRFKRDIREDVSGLSFVKQLKPVSYVLDNIAYDSHVGIINDEKMSQTRVVTNTNRSTGFVAQEVEAIVKKFGFAFTGVESPKNDKDTYSIRYSDFVVPLVKAVQELAAIVEKQQAEIELLKGGSLPNTKLNASADEKTNVILYQNAPNPFKVETEIRMSIPSTIREAKLYVYDLQGKPLNSFEIKERGNPSIRIEGGTLSSGMYLYALIADNKIIDIKKMILTE